jgi:hypothetical protein
MERIWDMSWELVDAETIRVEQSAGGGEAYAVDLHAIHVRLLASKLGLMQGDSNAWRRVATLERRLRVLHDRIEDLDGRLWSVPVYPPGSDNSDPSLMYSDATLEIAREFVADLASGGAVNLEERQEAQANASERQQRTTPQKREPQQAGLPLEVQQ